MDRQLIEALMGGRRIQKKAQASAFALIRTENGVEKVSLKDLETGHFDSKLGTTKRSRKGRTYKAANGYTKFAPNWDTEVIAHTTS